MPPPPHPGQISLELQQEINRRLAGDVNQRIFLSLAAIAVSGAYAGAPHSPAFNVLIREQTGWRSWRSGRPRPVPAALGAELDRALADPAFWREDGYVYGQPCPGKGRVMFALHRGRDKLSRQPCGPAGLAGRLADLAATGRVPATASRRLASLVETVSSADRDAEEIVLHLSRQSAAAWNQGNVELHLEPYAEDVTIVRPDGIEKGKQALRRRARSAQVGGGAQDPQLAIQAQTIRRLAPDTLVHQGQYQWHGGKRAAVEYREYRASSTWQKSRGKWEIVREEIGPEVAVKW